MALTINDVLGLPNGGLSPKCTATARSTGKRCRNNAIAGGVCADHGGMTPQVLDNEAARSEVDKHLDLYDPDAPPVTDPIAELQRLGGVARHAIDVAGRKTNELERWHSTDDKGARTLRVEIQLWGQLMKMAESIMTTLAKLGIDERRVAIAEREQALIVAVFKAVKASRELALTPEQRRVWPDVVSAQMQAIGGVLPEQAVMDAERLAGVTVPGEVINASESR